MSNDNGIGNENGYGYGYGPQGDQDDSHAGGSQRTQALPPQRGQQGRQPHQHQQQTQQIPSSAAQGGFVSAADIAMSHPHQGGKGAQNAYDQYARGGVSYSALQKKGMSRGKKIAIIVSVVVAIAIVAAGAALAFREMRKAEINADLHDMDKEELEAIDSQLTGHTNFDEPFTMLLLGSDERTDDPEMGARTDTIILVRVDPNNKDVSMVSIPRDTMVQLPGVGTAKINAAYYFGGAAGTISAVKELTGVEIDHYASVNFDGLVQLVDAIGGIDVYVDERIDDWKAGDVVVEAGQQHLNGAQALVLARSRDYADGDYTRQVNQRKVIMGIVEKAMNAPATELAGLIQASTGFIQTDSAIDFDWIYSLADQIRHTDTDNPLVVNSVTLPSRPAYIGDVSYVIADTAATAELMRIFLSGGDVSQPLTQSSLNDDVARAGGTASSSNADANANGGNETYYYEDDYYDDSYYYYYQEGVYGDGSGDDGVYVDEGSFEEPTYDESASDDGEA